MRAFLATAIAVSLAALTGGAQAREVSVYSGKCGEVVLPQGPSGLPAAIRVETSCGTFVVDGQRVWFLGVRKGRPLLDGLLWERGLLHFYQHGRLMWRSPPWRGEDLVGWTRANLLLTWREDKLTARAPSGRAVMHFATARNASHRFDPETRTFLLVSPRRELVRTDGRRSETLAALEPLGLGRFVEIVPLEFLRVALLGDRLVVLDSDGSVVASDRRRRSLPVVSFGGEAIVTISTGAVDGHGRAKEEVRLLRPGDRSSRALFAADVGAQGCGHWPSLEWRGEDLLYSTTEGDVGIIDTDSGDHLDLSTVVRRLPGDFVQAGWS
jgi:hypothetical protein